MVTNAMIGSQIANTRLTISLEAVACNIHECTHHHILVREDNILVREEHILVRK